MAFLKKTDELQKKLEKSAVSAVEVLAEIAKNEQLGAADRIRAANSLLDRCFGKPPQAVDFNSNQLNDATIDRLLAERSRAIMIDTGHQKIAISAENNAINVTENK